MKIPPVPMKNKVMDTEEAIQWIADNDESAELNSEKMKGLISIVLVADLSGLKEDDVIARVIEIRKARPKIVKPKG